MHQLAALPTTASEQDVADRRWLAARLGDARREILAARRWAWQLNDEREELQREVARLEAELAAVRAGHDHQRIDLTEHDVAVELGWPDAFPVVHVAPRAADDVVAGPPALAPAADEEPAQEWPRSTGAFGRRRGPLAVTVLPPGASRKERRSRQARRG